VSAVLGVDGGGRKTYAIVADGSGALLGAGVGGSSNWETAGLEGACEAVATSADAALEAAGLRRGALDASVFGLAGVDWPSDLGLLEGVIAPLGFGGPHRIVNDAFVALRAGTTQPWGAVVISGTGTVAAGRNPAGDEFRTIGEGRVFGDFGSEFDVSELAVRAVADAYTGRGPSTMLTELICDRAGVDTASTLLERLSRQDTRLRSPEVANMAPLVLVATERGDLVARTILEQIGSSLGDAAGLVASRLEMQDVEFEVVCAGNLFRTPNRYLMDQLELGVRRTAPRARPEVLNTPPVVGAGLMALELAGPTIGAGASPRLASAAANHFWGGGEDA